MATSSNTVSWETTPRLNDTETISVFWLSLIFCSHKRMCHLGTGRFIFQSYAVCAVFIVWIISPSVKINLNKLIAAECAQNLFQAFFHGLANFPTPHMSGSWLPCLILSQNPHSLPKLISNKYTDVLTNPLHTPMMRAHVM